MKWIRENYKGEKVAWYSGDVIEKIEDCAIKVYLARHCNNCDGVGYDCGCRDTDCGTYQANKILEIIESEEK